MLKIFLSNATATSALTHHITYIDISQKCRRWDYLALMIIAGVLRRQVLLVGGNGQR
jgi:hypothetical protein